MPVGDKLRMQAKIGSVEEVSGGDLLHRADLRA